jgi:type II secretory pathway pseudopilin PulG
MKKIKKHNQRGILLIEMILAMSLLSMFMVGVIFFMNEVNNINKNKSVAGYLNNLLNKSYVYVQDNYSDILQEVVDFQQPVEIDVQEDLIDNGYLDESYVNHNSAVKRSAVIRVLEKEKILHIFILIPDNEDFTILNMSKIANYIPNGNGGIYYGDNAAINFCPNKTSCIRGKSGVWQWDGQDQVTGDNLISDFENAFSGMIPASNISFVAHMKMDAGNNPFLYRKPIVNNLEANTMRTNLNVTNLDNNTEIQTGTSIFFNGLNDGTKLHYYPNNKNPNIVLEDDTSINPILSASGGLKQINVQEIDDFCDYNVLDKNSDYGKLAINENGKFMQCKSTGLWGMVNQDMIHLEDNPAAIDCEASAVIADIKTAKGERFQVTLPVNTKCQISNPSNASIVKIKGWIR